VGSGPPPHPGGGGPPPRSIFGEQPGLSTGRNIAVQWYSIEIRRQYVAYSHAEARTSRPSISCDRRTRVLAQLVIRRVERERERHCLAPPSVGPSRARPHRRHVVTCRWDRPRTAGWRRSGVVRRPTSDGVGKRLPHTMKTTLRQPVGPAGASAGRGAGAAARHGRRFRVDKCASAPACRWHRTGRPSRNRPDDETHAVVRSG